VRRSEAVQPHEGRKHEYRRQAADPHHRRSLTMAAAGAAR
jgi:hypothetical protein